MAFYGIVNYFTGHFYDFTTFYVAIMVVVSLEVVEVGITYRKRFIFLELSVQYFFYGDISRQPGQGTGIQTHLLKDLEFGGHSCEVVREIAEFITGRYLGVEVKVALRNAKSRPLQFFQRG